MKRRFNYAGRSYGVDGSAINPERGKLWVLEAERGGKWTGPRHPMGLSWPVFEDDEMVNLITSVQ